MADVVVVECNIANGLTLHVDDMREEYEQVSQGGPPRMIKKAYPRPETVRIFGPSTPHGEAPRTLIVGGYALTPNVDAEFWKAWIIQNAESSFVKANCIRAHQKQESAVSWAKEHAKVKSGLEPLDPDKDQRRPIPLNSKISEVTQDTSL